MEIFNCPDAGPGLRIHTSVVRLVRMQGERAVLTWPCPCGYQHYRRVPVVVARMFRGLGVPPVFFSGDSELRDHARDDRRPAWTEDTVQEALTYLSDLGSRVVAGLPRALIEDVEKRHRLEADARGRLAGLVHDAVQDAIRNAS